MATRRGSLPAWKLRLFRFLAKKSPSSTTSQGEVVFVSCSWPGRALSRAACAQVSPKPGSLGELSSFLCQVLKPSLVTNLETDMVKTCHPSTWHPYSCNLLGNGFSSPCSPYVWSAEHRQGAGAPELACASLVLFPFVLSYTQQTKNCFLFPLHGKLGLTKTKDKSATTALASGRMR